VRGQSLGYTLQTSTENSLQTRVRSIAFQSKIYLFRLEKIGMETKTKRRIFSHTSAGRMDVEGSGIENGAIFLYNIRSVEVLVCSMWNTGFYRIWVFCKA
jgi:hypothetical protein